MEILDISQRSTHFYIINSFKFHDVMSAIFQVHLQTNKEITTPKTLMLCWTPFALCGEVFANCEAANILTKARVSDFTQLTQRHKMKALHIVFLS